MQIPYDAGDTEDLLARALALAPGKRGAFLDAECGGDAARRARMGRMLDFAQSSGGFLDRSPLRFQDEDDGAAPSHGSGHLVGAYRLVRRIGAGGSGDVWLAERSEGGFVQQAAVKRVRDAQGASRERFESECEILASLSHPGIARLYDGGVERDGQAYMVMEYVEGEHLVAYAQAHSLGLPEMLALFGQVCDAVAYAHTRLIVHRDIKPANILVTPEGQAKLLDFGIAKLLGATPDGDATRTLHLSPAYAAPEQLTGDYVSTATDVHALGVTLFELLTGRLPWSDDGASLATAVKRLVDAPTAAPSRAVVAGSPIAGRALRGDLDAIVARSLRKEPAARYADARMLGDDIRRYLEHQPVRARDGARAYVLRRFLRRNWISLAVTTAVFVAMAVALVAIAWQAQRAKLEAQRAEAVQGFMVDLFRTNSSRQADPIKARQTTARELLDIGARRIAVSLDDAPETKLALLRVFGDLYDEFALSSDRIPVRRQAVALSRRVHGADSPQLASDLMSLAAVLDERTEAEALLAEAGAILDRRHDADSFLRGRLLAALAGRHVTTDMPRAREEAGNAVSILGRFPDSSELANALYVQGMADTYRGGTVDAIAPLQRAIAVSEAVDGSPNPMLSTYYKQLGEAQSFALQHAAAEASMEHALELAGADKAEYNYDRVRAQTALAAALVNADRPREALSLALQAKTDAPSSEGEDGDAFLRTYALNTASRAELRAGDPDSALADARSAVTIARRLDSAGLLLATARQREAEALVERGDVPAAVEAIDEAVDLLARAGRSPSEFNTILRIRLALDTQRVDDARTLWAALPATGGDSKAAFVAVLRRDLVQAEIALADGDAERAARLSSAVAMRAKDSELATSLRSVVSDAGLLEGRALARTGHADRACPLFSDALSIRIDLLLPKSPRIAEAQVALAECEFALGRRAESARLVDAARAIQAGHSALSPRYVEPLSRLADQLQRRSTPTVAAKPDGSIQGGRGGSRRPGAEAPRR